jgi:virulence-associated protein VagC
VTKKTLAEGPEADDTVSSRSASTAVLRSQFCYRGCFQMQMMCSWIRIDLCFYTVYTFSMKAKIQKWGNSLGIRIPIGISKELSLENGSIVDIAEKDNLILIKPMKKTILNGPSFQSYRRKYSR